MSIGLLQRVCADYRVPLFDILADVMPGGLSLYAGDPRPDEMIDQSQKPQKARLFHAENLHLFSGKYYFCIQRNVLRWLEQEDPQILIMEANMRYLLSPAAARWMHRKGRPVIGWGLGTGGTSGLLLRRHLAMFDALITYSSAGRQSYIDAGFPSERIFTACNAAVRRPDRPMPKRPPDRYDGDPILLYVGRLQKRKRLDLLMKACAAQPVTLQPRLWIIGDGPIRPELEDAARDLCPQTEFFGALYGNELTARFDRADLFCLPGTGGLALQQAMASALPLIAAEADGTQTDLVRPENGIRVKPGDQDELTEAIRQMLTDPAKLRTMGAESFRIVRDEINLEAMAAVFAQAVDFVHESGLNQ